MTKNKLLFCLEGEIEKIFPLKKTNNGRSILLVKCNVTTIDDGVHVQLFGSVAEKALSTLKTDKTFVFKGFITITPTSNLMIKTNCFFNATQFFEKDLEEKSLSDNSYDDEIVGIPWKS